MNVEIFFVKTVDIQQLSAIISARLKSAPSQSGSQPKWGLPSSYDILLANERKRKIIISISYEGWIAAVESKEVLDFELLQTISVNMNTEVIAVQLSDVTGECGYARCDKGKIQESLFTDSATDLLATLRHYLRKQGIHHDILTFREAVQLRSEGWLIIQ